MEIETERLRLRPVRPADRDDLFALEQDAEVMRFINGSDATPRECGSGGFLMPRGHETGVWTAVEKGSRSFAGWFSLIAMPAAEIRSAELGYRLRRALWGKGYATEGAIALIEAGFVHLGFERITAQTMTVNRPSRRVMEKAGLAHIRTFHLDWPDPLPGSEEGEVEYAATRDAWSKPPGPDA
jgi:RimJ/RimL family protein N-acetyltransferase